MVAVNKPAGVLTIPDRFRHHLPNLWDLLSPKRENLMTVHRLDKFTSGIIVFAKDKDTHRILSGLFLDRKIKKYYTALVDGVPYKKEGIIDEPMAESMVTRGKMLIHKRGKNARSEYTVTEEYGRFSKVFVRIYTGRLHQIRVHMAHIGHPLMVDPLYGKREAFFLSEIKGRKYKISRGNEERPLLSRQPLHATRLIFEHPHTKEILTLEAGLPKDMKATINQLRKWSIK